MGTGVDSTMVMRYLGVASVTGLLCIICLSSAFMQPANYGKIAFVSDRDTKDQITLERFEYFTYVRTDCNVPAQNLFCLVE